MMIKLALLTLTTFSLTTGVSQEPKNILQLEKTVTAIDNIIIAGDSIGQYIRPLFSDDGGDIFLNHRYTIDTTKRILHKAVYDYVNFEQITFYYNNQKIIKRHYYEKDQHFIIGRSCHSFVIYCN